MTRLHNIVHALAYLLLVVSRTSAQEVPRFVLQVSKELPVAGLSASPTLEPIKCDTRGNMYVRFFQVPAYTSPIVKISSEGERKASFSLEKVPQWEKGQFTSFEVGHDGMVYLLAVRPAKGRTLEHAVVVFNEEGQHRFTIPLKFPFRMDSLDHIAVLPRGEILLVGFRELESGGRQSVPTDSGETRQPDVEPILGIFDRNGALITEATVSFGSAAPTSRSASFRRLLPMPAIHGASLVIHEDGNLYAMFRREEPQIHVISSDGAEVRSFGVKPPTEESEAIDLAVAAGAGLIVFFAEKGERTAYPANKMTFSLVNPQTGERIYDYQSNPRLGGALGCYDRGSFLFLSSSQGKLAVVRANPK